ncbi:MAG: hypothetical protein EXX96DRAFT_619048 [Benjaminiella poitrasii]|nr:MAG: hypothetical protein EXX96DRAFT_619048 [Benjaminiella poitrasii]
MLLKTCNIPNSNINPDKLISSQLHVGDRVQLNSTAYGTVRFIGTTQFKAGTWAGVELDTIGSGKNDGSINGKRYFACPPKTGLFVLAIKLIKLQQHLNLINRPSTPYQKKKKQPITQMPPPPPPPSAATTAPTTVNKELQDRIKALEEENNQLKAHLQQSEQKHKTKDIYIQSLETSIQDLKNASIESLDLIEDLVQMNDTQLQKITTDHEAERRKFISQNDDLQKVGLEAIESYEATLLETTKRHHQEIKVLLEDMQGLEIVLQNKINREADLTESLIRERHYNSRLIIELKKKSVSSLRPSRLLDTPIEEEEDEDEVVVCALCEDRGHNLIHCPLLLTKNG